MLEELEQVLPGDIEKRSFEIITEELGERTFDPLEEPIIKRCIHTSADFDYADQLYFSPGAVKIGIEAIKKGARIVTDTNMGKAGVNKTALGKFGGEVLCFMADEDVAEAAKREGTTRAVASVKKAAALKAAEATGRPMEEPEKSQGACPRLSFPHFSGEMGLPRRSRRPPGALRPKDSFGATHPKGTYHWRPHLRPSQKSRIAPLSAEVTILAYRAK